MMDFAETAVSTAELARATHQRSALFEAGDVRVLVSQPTDTGTSDASLFLRKHPDGVGMLIFEVEDIDTAFRLLEERGGTPTTDVVTVRDGGGTFRTFGITTPFGDTEFRYTKPKDNHSKSCQRTLRGLHNQVRQPQGKLIRVISGEIFDVAVDIRRHSPTFGQWVGDYLSAENKKMLWVPAGFAHGFYVTSPVAEVLYKASDYYAPQWERCLLWNDPAVGIRWPLGKDTPILSPKDALGKLLAEADTFD